MSFIHRNSITFPSGNIPQFNARQMRGDILLTLLPTNRSDEKTCWRGKLRTFFEGLHIRDIGVGASGQKKNIEQDRFYEFHGYPVQEVWMNPNRFLHVLMDSECPVNRLPQEFREPEILTRLWSPLMKSFTEDLTQNTLQEESSAKSEDS